jgi:signal transduction histidine kinase
MGGRLVCIIEDGQVGTCIRDDEDCSKCEPYIQLAHKKTQNEYNHNDNVCITQEQHAQNLLDICELIKHLKVNNDTFRELAPIMKRAAMFDLADFIVKYTDEIDKTLHKINSLVGKHYYEELIFVQQDTAKLKQVVDQINNSLKRE